MDGYIGDSCLSNGYRRPPLPCSMEVTSCRPLNTPSAASRTFADAPAVLLIFRPQCGRCLPTSGLLPHVAVGVFVLHVDPSGMVGFERGERYRDVVA